MKKLTPEEKKVIKSLVAYHLKEAKKDKRGFEASPLAAIGIENRYEEILKTILKKLK